MNIGVVFITAFSLCSLIASEPLGDETKSQAITQQKISVEQPAFAPALHNIAHVLGMNAQSLQQFCDDTDFYAPKTTITMPVTLSPTDNTLDTVSVIVSYDVRWGYRGAGNPEAPFAGATARVAAPINYDGITVDLTKSRRFSSTVLKKLEPYTTLSPIDEFVVKFIQLLWTHALENTPEIDQACASLHTLFSRLRITHGSSELKVRDFALLGTDEYVGLDTLFYIAPERVMRNLIAMTRDMCYHCGIVATPSQEVSAFSLRALFEQTNYQQDETVTVLHDGIVVNLPFGYAGAGEVGRPFTGLTSMVSMQTEQSDSVAIPLTHIHFSPVQECIVKLLLLTYQVSKKVYEPHQAAAEYNALLLRLSITPDIDELDSHMRSLLYSLCSGINRTIAHDFDAPITTTLAHSVFVEHLVSILYRLYVMHTQQQAVSVMNTFLSVQLARSVKASQLFADMTSAGQEHVPLTNPSDDRLGLDMKLFLQTLLAE